MRLFASAPKKSEYEKAFATVQKAATSGRQLIVDKKGNLKSRGVFSNFFLRLRVSCYSEKGYKKFKGGERNEVRSAVLKKLEGVARQSRKDAILNSHQGSLDPEKEGAALDGFLDHYIELRQESYEKNELADDFDNSRFNSAVVKFLSLSKSATYSRKPESPGFYDPGKPLANREGLASHQKTQLASYQKLMTIYELAAATKRIIEQTGFHEPPKPFPEASQNRVQFFSGDRVTMFREIEEFGGSDAPGYVLGAMETVTFDDAHDAKMEPRFSSRKKWNQADFKAQSEKRVSGEVNKRGRLGQALPQQDISARTVNFLCFLRKNVQTQLAEGGDLSEQLQPLFNENSAVSVQGSSSRPDRLIPSKKLVARALDICMGDTGVAPPPTAERQVPTFSDDVKVREIDSRHVDKGLLQVAVQGGQFETSPIQERKILGYEQESNPTTAEEALDGSTYHYEAKDLPEGFEKHVLGKGVSPTAAEPGLASGGEEMGGITDGSWLKEQYAAWLTSEQNSR